MLYPTAYLKQKSTPIRIASIIDKHILDIRSVLNGSQTRVCVIGGICMIRPEFLFCPICNIVAWALVQKGHNIGIKNHIEE
jgi:hypothetical protein